MCQNTFRQFIEFTTFFSGIQWNDYKFQAIYKMPKNASHSTECLKLEIACNIYIYIYVPSTHAWWHVLLSISRLSLRDKVTLPVLKPYFINSGCGRVVSGAGHKAKRLVLQCINGVSSTPVEGRTKICQFKDLILKLFGLILFS